MANRRPPPSGRRMDFMRNDRGKNFRPGVSPWQGGAPGNDIPNLLPITGGSTEATLALASNIINLLQPRQNSVPSLLDMPIRRDFGPPMGRFDRGYPPNRMGNQGNFRRTGNYNRSGERMNSNRKPFRPNDGQRQQNKSSPKKDADSKNKPKESEQEKEKSDGTEKVEDKQEEKKDSQKTRYDDINQQLLRCHICNKSMWDGRSFENHLSGRAHSIMMQKTVESYALTADTMRQEFKIRDMKRNRKSGQQPNRDFYCAMCDMYAADGSGHRTTVGHRKLKKYLHPTCTACHKEMPTRIELDEHRLTPEHLRMIQDKQDVSGKLKPEGNKKKFHPAPWLTDDIKLLLEKKKILKANYQANKSEVLGEEYRQIRNRCNILCRDAQRRFEAGDSVMMISNLQAEQQYLRDDRDRQRNRKHMGDKGKNKAEKEVEEGQEKEKEDGDKEKVDGDKEKVDGDEEKADEEVKVKESIDKEDTILDYTEGEDLTNITDDKYPVYSTERGVGRSFLSEFKCFQCQLCKKLLDSEETAEVHLRTWRHHQLFVRLLNEKSGKDTIETREPFKRPHNIEESGNWKRRKTSPEPNDSEEAAENGHNAASVKEEKADDVDMEGEAIGESESPKADDLEDWVQSVDELLEEVDNDNDASAEINEKDVEKEDADKQPESKIKVEDNTITDEEIEIKSEVMSEEENPPSKRVTRGRGRGRRRN
ncbi:zinc finger protein on ecdysone puffs isoform X2 [Pieris napi]|uniref:zinc finger protein on ecdysone puffs isoform X2 n=1 Tax=Pieris napi TaxID=78633 RepID=UPI001FBBDE88|nr:zinc finger protein on ecdysone puffs isoform X2 [Pieris napi]